MKKEHDGKRGCGAKRFSGAHPLRRAFHVRSGWLFFLSDFKRRFALVCVAIARAVFEKYDAGRVLVCRRVSAGTCIKTSTRPAITIQDEPKITRHLPVANSTFAGQQRCPSTAIRPVGEFMLYYLIQFTSSPIHQNIKPPLGGFMFCLFVKERSRTQRKENNPAGCI